MHFLKISVAVVAFVASVSAQATTLPIYSDYTYCDGITPVAHKTYQPIKGATLKKVQVMMRHGDRTPAAVLPGDHTNYNICSSPAEYNFIANKNSLASSSANLKTNILISEDNIFAGSFWKGNCEVGQLTNRGSAQTRKVGGDLRAIYVDELKFMPKTLNPADVYVRNTYVWRTRMSAENFLEGFYPPEHRHKDAVITLNTYPQNIETLTLNPTACPRLGQIITNFYKSPTYANSVKASYPLMTKINTVLGVNNISAYNTSIQADSVLPRMCNNLPMGCSATDKTMCITKKDAVDAIAIGTFAYAGFLRYESTAEEAKRLAVGAFLKTLSASIRETTFKKNANKRVRPFELYSAHDQSLDQVLSVIADPRTPWPAYASNVIIEVWNTGKKDVVRVLYEGKVLPANPKLACNLSACPIDTFLNFIESYVPKNVAAECAPVLA